MDIVERFWRGWLAKDELERVEHLRPVAIRIKEFSKAYDIIKKNMGTKRADWFFAQTLNSYFTDLESVISLEEEKRVKCASKKICKR